MHRHEHRHTARWTDARRRGVVGAGRTVEVIERPKHVVGFTAAYATDLGISTGVYYGYGLLFAGFVRPIAVPLLWPARLLIPAAAGSPVATSIAIVGNAVLYAIAAAVADRIYARND